METLDIIKDLCKKHNISLSGLEKKLGYGNTSLSKAKNISSKRIVEIASFFNVPAGYLLGVTDTEGNVPTYTIDTNDVSDTFERSMETVSEYVYRNLVNRHPEIAKQNEIFSNHSVEEVKEAIDLYELYQNADDRIRSAVEALLKSQQP